MSDGKLGSKQRPPLLTLLIDSHIFISIAIELNCIFFCYPSSPLLVIAQTTLGLSRPVDKRTLRLQRTPTLNLQAGGATSIASSTSLRLGTLLTPPDTSPVRELSGPSLPTEDSGPGGSMGSFVFQWCVRTFGAMATKP